ncbi:hypothetical protein AB0J52_35280, partial [Spirillospora sp. NPDC049652]
MSALSRRKLLGTGALNAAGAAVATASPARTAGLASFTALFGEKAKSPVRTAFQWWDDEAWSGGGPVGTVPPGVLTESGP